MGSDRPAGDWISALDLAHPCWLDLLDLLQGLPRTVFPGCDELNTLLSEAWVNDRGIPLRFVPSDQHEPGPYEERIAGSGLISTRPGNWHDLFNALIWARLPRLKTAMNTMHCRPQPDTGRHVRGSVRDALTLFDECGMVVASPAVGLLQDLSRHNWGSAFGRDAGFWNEQVTLVVTGHALLEKLVQPYKAVTANCLLLQVDHQFQRLPRERRVEWLDEAVSKALLEGELLKRTSRLSPLPLMGIPGWWTQGHQDSEFYLDPDVFRPLREQRKVAPICDFTDDSVFPVSSEWQKLPG